MIEKETGLSIPQITFMGSKKDMEDIVGAIVRIQNRSDDLKQTPE
jgi:hypothetical protein